MLSVGTYKIKGAVPQARTGTSTMIIAGRCDETTTRLHLFFHYRLSKYSTGHLLYIQVIINWKVVQAAFLI